MCALRRTPPLRFISLFLLSFAIFASVCVSRADTAAPEPAETPASSTARGVIAGRVVDASGSVLKGARIELQPLGITAVADAQGEYLFTSVPAGDYTLTVSYVGFKTDQTTVTVQAGQTLRLTEKLLVSSAKEEVLVTAERQHGEAEAINRIRTADNIVDVLPSEVITSLPNANVADALGRMSSVALYRIEGEGVYAQVRGTEPRLTNIMVDGITIPSPEPTVRQLRLDIIPSDLVESIELNKTLSANMDGDGIGGSVNLRTKTAGEEPYLSLAGNGGFTPILDGRSLQQWNGTYGQRFGADKKFGILFGGTYDFNGRGIDNIQPSLDPRSTFAQPFYDNDTIREYRYYRNRFGFSGSADYKLGEFSSLYAHGIFSTLQDYGDKWYYSPQSTAISSSGALPSLTAASPAPKFYTSNKRPDASVGNFSAGGRHVFKTSWLNWEVSASRSYELDSAGNPKADFSWIGSSLYCNFNPAAQSSVYVPTFGACDGPNSPLQNASLWALKDLTTSTGLTAQLNLTAATSFAKNYHVGSHFATLEMGLKIRNGHKYQDATENVYDGWSYKAANPAVTMTSLLDPFHNNNYLSGDLFGGQFGPVSSFTTAQNYVLQNLASYIDPIKTAATTYPNIFDIVERITAGYVMNTVAFGKLSVQTGLRFEGTQMYAQGYNVTIYPANSSQCGGGKNPGCGIPVSVTNSPSYVDPLPSVQLRYALTNDSDIRAVFSRGVVRPDAYQLVPYVTEDTTASPTTVAVGNPNLKPEHAYNYDLLYQKYFRPLGIVQAGFFYKQLSDPQVVTTIPGSINTAQLPAGYLPPELQSILATGIYTGDSVTMYVNGKSASLYGFEASYTQHMTFLPGILHGLGLSANYAYTASHIDGLAFRTDTPALQMQTPNVWNISPTYDTKRLSARLGLSYNGPCIFQYSWLAPTLIAGSDPSGLGPKGPSGDIYTYPHMQVDAQMSYRLPRGLTLMAYGLNLTNEVFGYYQGSPQFVNQREYYKPSYAFGMKYDFGGHAR
jgi:TonB-dependent receptor